MSRALGNREMTSLLSGETEAPRSVGDVVRAPGQPLPESTRARMEASFGQSLADVRVHTDAAAARSADELDANAYTLRSDVVFGAGRYRPGTPAGDRLVSHEIAHVLQQRGSGPAADAPRMGPSGGALERQADAAAGAVARGEAAGPVAGSAGAGGVVQCEKKKDGEKKPLDLEDLAVHKIGGAMCMHDKAVDPSTPPPGQASPRYRVVDGSQLSPKSAAGIEYLGGPTEHQGWSDYGKHAEKRFYGHSGTAPIIDPGVRVRLELEHLAGVESGEGVNAFLTVVDNKADHDEGTKTKGAFAPRVLIYFGRKGDRAEALQREWVEWPVEQSGGVLPDDLEGLSPIPGRPTEFLVAQSSKSDKNPGGEMFHVELVVNDDPGPGIGHFRFNILNKISPKRQAKGKDTKGREPKDSKAHEIEGLATGVVGGAPVAAWAGRGEGFSQGFADSALGAMNRASGDTVALQLHYAPLVSTGDAVGLDGKRGGQKTLQIPSLSAKIAQSIDNLSIDGDLGSEAAVYHHWVAEQARRAARASGALGIDANGGVYTVATVDSDQVKARPGSFASSPLVGGFRSTLFRVGKLSASGDKVGFDAEAPKPVIEFFGMKVEGLSIWYDGATCHMRFVSDDEQPAGGHVLEVTL